jgi:hypothetical protein
MPLARRKFIQSSLIFTATAVLFSESAKVGFARSLFNDGQLPDEVLRDPVYSFSKETFEPYVGGYFEAVGPRGENVPLKLVKVDSYCPKAQTKICKRAHETVSFSLQFTAEGSLPASPSIYQIKHGALGDFKLFLNRRVEPSRQVFYEAVFNRLK